MERYSRAQFKGALNCHNWDGSGKFHIGGVNNLCNWSVDYKLTNEESIKANLLNFFLISLME